MLIGSRLTLLRFDYLLSFLCSQSASSCYAAAADTLLAFYKTFNDKDFANIVRTDDDVLKSLLGQYVSCFQQPAILPFFSFLACEQVFTRIQQCLLFALIRNLLVQSCSALYALYPSCH